MINLPDTAALMSSGDYKERFKAEYYQLSIRLDKLTAMIEKWDKNELNFNPTCPRELYDVQITAMKEYLNVLKQRAKLENVEL